MANELNTRLVIGISSRALFDLEKENEIYEREGAESYRHYQLQHERELLKPGPGFALVQALLGINGADGRERVEVLLMSRNDAEASLRIFHSIEQYGLKISRAALSGGAALSPYLEAFRPDLFLSATEEDAKSAAALGIASGLVSPGGGSERAAGLERGPVRIAFDGDAVLFTDESERIYQTEGLFAFEENEKRKASEPLNEGLFAGFLRKVAAIQEEFPSGQAPFRTALVTSRRAPAHERAIRTLLSWNVHMDEVFFLGGLSKREVLEAFGAHVFFDDRAEHTDGAGRSVCSVRVLYGNQAGDIR